MATTLSVDTWALKEVKLNTADQTISDVFVANAGDANGRGIDLYVTNEGTALDMTGMAVYLAWGHEDGGQGLTEFTAVNASAGHFAVYYPTQMQRAGTVLARVLIYVGAKTPITGSRDFRIFVERSPIDEGAALTTDDFTVFQTAIIDLNTAKDNLEESTEAANEAARSATEAEAATRSSELVRSDAEGRRVAAEIVRATAETARGKAEASRATAESSRANAETSRSTAETKRAAAESSRASAEADRAEKQAKNNADQAMNNAAMKKLEPYVCADGEYDHATLMPTVKGEANRLYLAPSGQGPANRYVEWMIVAGAWEMMGVSDIDVRPVTTDEVDSVVEGRAPAGEGVLSLTGLSYLWAKLRDRFAAARHRHGCSDLDGVLLTAGSRVGRNVLEVGITPDNTSQISIKTKIPYSANNMCAVRVRGTANYLVADLAVAWYDYTDGGTLYSPRISFAGDALPLSAYVSTYDDAGTERIAITLVGDTPGALRFGGFSVDCFIYNKAAPRACFEGWACSTSTAASPSIAPAGRLAKCSVASSVGKRQITPPMMDRAYRALTGKPSITGGEDLDGYRSAGSYKCEADAWANTIKNCPTGGRAFELIVNPVLDNSTYLRQEVKPYDSCKRYERVSTDAGKTWHRWVQTSVSEAPQYIDMGGGSYAVKHAGWARIGIEASITAKPWSDNLVCTLPAGYRPKRAWEAVGAHNAGNVLIVVAPSGKVTVNPFGATLSASRIYGGIAYPLEAN